MQNVPKWTPEPSTIKCENKTNLNYEATRLTFSQFDLNAVLQKGAHLIGSEGTEFDCHEESLGEDSNGSMERDRLTRQRQLLNEKLGLNQSSQLGILNINDLVTLEDMRNHQAGNAEANKALRPVQDVLNIDAHRVTEAVATSSSAAGGSLSCREMNRAKRKARQFQSQVSTSNGGTNSTSTNSVTYSRSNSFSNDEQQPDVKKSKIIETEFVPCTTGKLFFPYI